MEIAECGAACLAMVLAHFGRWVALEEARSACGVSRDGSNLAEVLKAARSYGLVGHAHKGTLDDLAGIRTPTILWWKLNHFVVLERMSKRSIRVDDPATGRRRIPLAEARDSYSGIALTLEPGPDFVRAGHPPRVARNLAAKLRYSRDGVVLAVLIGLLSLIPGLALPIVSQIFVDNVLGDGQRDLIVGLCSVLVVLAVVRVGLNQLQRSAVRRMQKKLTMVGSAAFLEHLLRLPIEFFGQRRIGDIAQRVGMSARLPHLMAGQIAGAVLNVFALLAYGIMLIVYSWEIALIVVVVTLANVGVAKLIFGYRKNLQQRITRDSADLHAESVATIQTIESIKATGASPDAFRKWIDAVAKLVSAQQSAVGPRAAMSSIPVLIGVLLSSTILVIGGFQVMDGDLSIGGLAAVQTLVGGLIAPIMALINSVGRTQVIGVDVQRVDDVLKHKLDPRFYRMVEPEPDCRLRGGLELRSVTFGYRRTAEPLVKDFDLTLRPGARVAIVGATGSGKTTVANLAAGLMQPWSGSVTYDGYSPDRIPPGVREAAIAKIDQSILLFEGTVRQNITFFDTAVPESIVRQALADAQVLDDVLTRADGLDALVEEGGRNFSGGQRQRLEIARALALQPKLLILDEATSALDPVSEQALDNALRARGISCLIVAHRLSTIRDSDEIVVLERGSVVERGSHPELMRRNGLYSRLVARADLGGHVGA